MKNLFKIFTLTAITFMLPFVCLSQTFSFSNNDGVVSDTIFVGVDKNVFHEEHVFITNNSSSDIDVKVRVDEIEILDGSENTFCWGSCFTPGTVVSPTPITILAGATNSSDFYIDYFANGYKGVSIIRYIFFDMDNVNDTADVIIKITSDDVSINQHKSNNSFISNPYPNPANNNCKFSYDITSNTNEAVFIITDILGNKLYSNIIDPNNNDISIDLSTFSSGLYFYSLILDGKAISTKKLIVVK